MTSAELPAISRRPGLVTRLEPPVPVPYGVRTEPNFLCRLAESHALPEQFKAQGLFADFDWLGARAFLRPVTKLSVYLLCHLSPFPDKKETLTSIPTVSQIRGAVQFAPQASAFTRLLALMCPLELSLIIPRSRVDEEKNTKSPRRVSMGCRASTTNRAGSCMRFLSGADEIRIRRVVGADRLHAAYYSKIQRGFSFRATSRNAITFSGGMSLGIAWVGARM